MLRKLPIIFSIVLVLQVLTVHNAAAKSDIDGHWGQSSMEALIQLGILGGYANGNYGPDDDVTRAEFATFLVRSLELQAVEGPTPFKDVKENAWYYHNINTANYYGLVKGDNYGNFNPNAHITRQEMAVMLKRTLDHLNIKAPSMTFLFTDSSDIKAWAKSDIDYVVSLGLIGGMPNNRFAPLEDTTRAQAAVVIYRLINLDPETAVPIVNAKVITKTRYSANYETALSRQVNNSPKVDGAGLFLATKPLVSYYLNPSTFSENNPYYYQFLKLSVAVKNLNADTLNSKVLANKGVLHGTASAFIQAGEKYDINAIYLMSHAMHETGNGTSLLAKGIDVGLNASGKPEMVTDENRETLINIRTTHNMYGIGAVDANPNKLGAERAYTEGWFSVQDAIVGGAKFVAERYIDIGQDTLYKMRWNPDNPTDHQYATHVMWAVIQAQKIYDIYTLTNLDKTTTSYFDVPIYDNQSAPIALPKVEDRYAVDTKLGGTKGKTNVADVNMRTYPNTTDPSSIIRKLPIDAEFIIVGTNGGWYKVKVDNVEGWLSGQYVNIVDTELPKPDAGYEIDTKLNGTKGKTNVANLNMRTYPNTTDPLSIIRKLPINTAFTIIGTNGDWYKVRIDNVEGWLYGQYVNIVE